MARKINLYRIFDRKAEAYDGPMMMEYKDGPAIRNILPAFEDSKTKLGSYPSDYELWCIGEHDEETGAINGEPRLVFSGREWKALEDAKARNQTPELVQ